jgi:hypothetical protein
MPGILRRNSLTITSERQLLVALPGSSFGGARLVVVVSLFIFLRNERMVREKKCSVDCLPFLGVLGTSDQLMSDHATHGVSQERDSNTKI